MPSLTPPIVLFGYHSSAFTQKVRMVLKLKRIPYTWVTVPSMMPRPTLTSLFALTYRKIPVLAIGHDVYCDTSLIIEALEQHSCFQSPQHQSLYPASADGRDNRALMRLFSSYYTDRPWFRVNCGLVPGAVWRSCFGRDRGPLIGHPLDAAKLEAKIPRNLTGLELQMSILETQLQGATEQLPWLFSTQTPSLADISLFFMLDWGRDVSRGRLIKDLTGGESEDITPELEGMDGVFNKKRFLGLWGWFHQMKEYFAGLPESEERKIERGDGKGVDKVVERLNAWRGEDTEKFPMLSTPLPWNEELDAKSGLRLGVRVSVAPDDTGRGDPIVGELLVASAEEVVIRPVKLEGQAPRVENVRVHFPRLGFVIKPLSGAKETKL